MRVAIFNEFTISKFHFVVETSFALENQYAPKVSTSRSGLQARFISDKWKCYALKKVMPVKQGMSSHMCLNDI